MTTLTYHGGRLDAAAALYPDAPGPWLDLSTGINPVAWQPPPALTVEWQRLPSPVALKELEANAAAFFGASASSVAAVPGTEIALRMLGRFDLPAPYHYVAPTYRTHAEVFENASPIGAGDASRVSGTLLLANPNNPDGRLLSCATLRALARERWLIVDEAFADCDPAWSIVPDLPEKVVVLRSFGKFFGLAGARLGFVIGPADVIAHVRAMLGDWPVCAAAIAFGTAAYRDTAWVEATRARLVEDARALDTVLQLHGLQASGACPLFRLVRCDAKLFARLANAGILTRPFDYAAGLMRIGLPPDRAALTRLDSALRHG